MESITVYQKIPHPGIQVNLNSYYSEQVSAVSRENGQGGQAGGEAQPRCVVPALGRVTVDVTIPASVEWEETV